MNKLSIKVLMVNGKAYELDVHDVTFEEINKYIEKHKFVRFGSVILNTSQILSIEKF